MIQKNILINLACFYPLNMKTDEPIDWQLKLTYEWFTGFTVEIEIENVSEKNVATYYI